MADALIPALPVDAALTYLAEGGANVVYRVRLPPGTPPPTEVERWDTGTPPPSILEDWEVAEAQSLEDSATAAAHNAGDAPVWPHPATGTVLRLRKAVPHVRPVAAAQRDYETRIAPLFLRAHLVDQALVQVPGAVLDELNAHLRQAEQDGTRPAKRRGAYLRRDEAIGVVMPDMGFWRPEQRGVTLDWKPKWLTQSLDAPAGARRCRTCALRAMRRADGAEVAREREWCPLRLAEGGEEGVQNVLRRVEGAEAISENTVWKRVVEEVRDSAVIANLRDAQIRLDRRGVLGMEEADRDLLAAMTIRDCTIFVRIPVEPPGPCEIRLGDLDLKSSEKFGYWKAVERSLVDGGWYTVQREAVGDADGCFLERSNTTSS